MLGESKRKRGMGNTRKMRLDIGSYFECKGNGSRET